MCICARITSPSCTSYPRVYCLIITVQQWLLWTTTNLSHAGENDTVHAAGPLYFPTLHRESISRTYYCYYLPYRRQADPWRTTQRRPLFLFSCGTCLILRRPPALCCSSWCACMACKNKKRSRLTVHTSRQYSSSSTVNTSPLISMRSCRTLLAGGTSRTIALNESRNNWQYRTRAVVLHPSLRHRKHPWPSARTQRQDSKKSVQPRGHEPYYQILR